MKKSISIILASICIVGLVGCGTNKNTNIKTTENQPVAQEQNTEQKNTTDVSKSEEQSKENNGEKASTSPLIGKWSDVKKGTEIEFTKDGKLFRAGNEVATYETTDENTVKLHNTDDTELEVKYEIDGDTLKWGTNFEKAQELTKIIPVG